MTRLAKRMLSESPTETVEVITPAEAKRLILSAPSTNRIRPSTLAWWIKAIEEGVIPSGSPIRIDWNDRLKDGWHRLLAVIFTGKTTSFPVLRG